MHAPIFVDTNLLIYALDDADPGKQQAARAWRAALWQSRRGRISYQVLQEFYVKITQKWPKKRSQAREEIRDLLAWGPTPVDDDMLERSWKLQDRYRFSFGDALIVAAAQISCARYLLTEDLQADQELDGVRVINPFLLSPEAIP